MICDITQCKFDGWQLYEKWDKNIIICRTMNYEQTLLSLFFSFNDKSAASGFMSTNTQDFQIRYLEFKRQHKGIKNPPLP